MHIFHIQQHRANISMPREMNNGVTKKDQTKVTLKHQTLELQVQHLGLMMASYRL